jgi:hypothetical protein
LFFATGRNNTLPKADIARDRRNVPLAPGFFAILVGLFLIVLILRSVRYAYESLGVSSNTAILCPLYTQKRISGGNFLEIRSPLRNTVRIVP